MQGPHGATIVSQELMPVPLMSVQGIVVRFGGVLAVGGVSFDVGRRQICGLIGPNGAGKTTLFNCISGIYKYSEGDILFDGKSIRSTPRHRMAALGIGRTFQNVALFRSMTVRDNILVGAHQLGHSGFIANALRLPFVRGEDERAEAGLGRSFQNLELFEDLTVQDNLCVAAEQRDLRSYFTDLFRPSLPRLSAAARRAVVDFQLGDDLHRTPTELSYGKRRLLAIARSVARQPSVLLLDEPAAGLDETESRELGTLLRRLADEWGTAVLLVEHDMGLVMEICDRVVVLEFGRKIADGAPEEVRRDESVIAAYLGQQREAADDQLPAVTTTPSGVGA